HILPLAGVGVVGDGVGATSRPVAAKGEVAGLLHRAVALPDGTDTAQVVGIEVVQAVVGRVRVAADAYGHGLPGNGVGDAGDGAGRKANKVNPRRFWESNQPVS
ncbi:MAG: hypothetical protein D6706_01285, partial [Chloroflexi bacterium]